MRRRRFLEKAKRIIAGDAFTSGEIRKRILEPRPGSFVGIIRYRGLLRLLMPLEGKGCVVKFRFECVSLNYGCGYLFYSRNYNGEE